MQTDVDGLICRLRDGDETARDRLFELCYQDLKAIAREQLRRRGGGTLDTTEVLHDAYLRLAQVEKLEPQDHLHFVRIVGRAMRSVIVDHARSSGALKRGGDRRRVSLTGIEDPSSLLSDELLALDEALSRLEKEDARLASVVELRFFAGLSVEETAEALQTSSRTVKRDWRVARAVLLAELSEADRREG